MREGSLGKMFTVPDPKPSLLNGGNVSLLI